MIRTTILALALAGILSCAAVAADGGNWQTATGAPSVKKAIDIIEHGAELRALTHDYKVYSGVYVPASKTVEWPSSQTIRTGSITNPGNNNCSWRLYGKSAVWPQIVSFGGDVYASALYMTVREGPGGSCTNYMYPEYRVIKLAGGTDTTVFQMGGSPSTAWQCGANFNFYNPIMDTMVGGYLFTSGGTLYWGGGGGKQINPVAEPSGLAANINWASYGSDYRYVYSTGNGTDWALVNRTLGNDEFGRAIPAAMPSGYRYSHLLEFPKGGGIFYDCYGTYTGAALGFTPYAAGSPHTEPWGWFLMGRDTASIYRIAHSKKGDKNYLYATNAPGGAWNPVGGAGAPNNGSVYWRACAAISDNTNTIHNGIYCTYSADYGGGNFESGVYRYFPDDAGGKRAAGWSKCISTADARVYTGAIYIKKDDAIYVGTSNGILRRPINDTDQPPGNTKAKDPDT